MRLGAVTLLTDYSISPGELARELEAHGYESLWAGDHSHVPVTSRAVRVDDPSGAPQRGYKHLYDPLVALSFAAAATTRLLLGTGMLLLNQRDPIGTAKAVATLDRAAGGRVLFGVAPGWNTHEMRNHGIDPSSRTDQLRERLAAIRTIWACDVAAFEGEHVRFGPIVSWPKPVLGANVPVLVGCGDRAFRALADVADEWAPIVAPGADEHTLPDRVRRLRSFAAELGRARLPVTVFRGSPADGIDGREPLVPIGARELERYRAAGADRVVVMIPNDRDRALATLEGCARLLL